MSIARFVSMHLDSVAFVALTGIAAILFDSSAVAQEPAKRTVTLPAVLYPKGANAKDAARQTLSPAPGKYTLRAGHPRIFAGSEAFRRIAAQCGEGGLMEASYKNMLDTADKKIDPKSSYYPRAYCGPIFAFVYRVETELGREGSRFLRHIKDVLWKADGSGINGMDFSWDAILYDWIHDTMTPEERTLYGNKIGSFLRHGTNVPEITLQNGTYWYNQTWGPIMGISWSRDGIAPKTMVALAIAGEKTDHEEDARRWLDSFAKRMPEEFVKKSDQPGGVWPEGPNHGNCSYAPFITWAMFTAAPAFTSYGHGSGCVGAFQILKQGTLAGVAGYQHWTSAAIPNSQNVVTVYDPKEKYFNRTGVEVSRNDGGPQSPNFAHALEPMKHGEIVAYEHRNAYTYVAADLTQAYSSVRDDEKTKDRTQSQKLSDFTRQFLYVRGTPEFFINYDRVRATDAAFPKTSLTHLQNKPEILGTSDPLTTVKEGPGFRTYLDADGVLSRVASRDGKYWKTNMRGAVGIRTLLPKKAQITIRGGKDFELWGNPHDPKADNGVDNESRFNQSDIDICMWRVEVEPVDLAKEHNFLHILVPFDDAAEKETAALSPAPAAFKLMEKGDQENVSLETVDGSWTILFNRQGPLGGAISVRKGNTPAFTARFANEVKPNAMPAGLAISSN